MPERDFDTTSVAAGQTSVIFEKREVLACWSQHGGHHSDSTNPPPYDVVD